MEERLQKLMARANVGSRRHNEALIRAGEVRVNGRVARLGDKADPQKDYIEVKGRRLQVDEVGLIYIALNKPKGVLSSLEDELKQNRRTVRDLIEIPGHLYPVGRLDKQSEGLMLMTNDGQLAHRLTHPRYGHHKLYEVTLVGVISAEALNQWRRGVYLDEYLTQPARIKVLKQTDKLTRLHVTLREGRKRQIRRIAAQFECPVQRLVRLQIGPLQLGNLKPGQWRYLQPAEIATLQRTVRQLKKSGREGKRRR